MSTYEVPHVWVTARGERIPIKDMSDGHLNNTIRMLERRGWTTGRGAVLYPQYPRLLREREARALALKIKKRSS